jgi:hypothetical protein
MIVDDKILVNGIGVKARFAGSPLRENGIYQVGPAKPKISPMKRLLIKAAKDVLTQYHIRGYGFTCTSLKSAGALPEIMTRYTAELEAQSSKGKYGIPEVFLGEDGQSCKEHRIFWLLLLAESEVLDGKL